MKLNSVTALLVVSSIAGLYGCGAVKEAAKDVKQGLENPDLMHKWENEHCSSSKILGKSYRVQFEFVGDNVKKTEQYYSSADCQELGGEVIYSGTFEKKGEVQKDVNEVDMRFNSVKVVALNPKGQDLLNTVNFCGKSDWMVNQEIDLTAHTRDSLCPLTALPEETFDVYHVENEKLFFGRGGDKSVREKRPVQVDFETSFRKI